MPRALRIAAWSLGGLLLLVLLLIAAVIAIGNTAAGRRLLASETAKLTSGRVLLSGLGGRFPGDLEIASLELRDAQGEWLRAQQISIHWSPLALFAWDLHIESFGIQSADVLRRPISGPSTSAAKRTARSKSSSSHLPAIDIDRMAVGTLVLEPAAAGMKARLSLHGDLHYRSMKDARGRLVARRTNGTGDYEVALRLDRSAMRARLELEEPAGGPLEHLLNVPGLGALSVLASLDGPRSAEKLALDAHAGQLSAHVKGTVDLVSRAADLSYSIDSPPMSPRPGLAWRRVALQGRWVGPVTAPHATGDLDLEGLQLPNGAQLGSMRAKLAANGRVLTLRATAQGILLAGSQPQLLQGSPLELNATWRLDAAGRPLQLSLTHRLLDLDVHAITAGSRSASFDLRLNDLAVLAAHYHEDIGGTMSLSGKVAQQGRNTTLDVTGTGDLAGASMAAKLLGPDMRLHVAGTLTPATVNIDTLRLTGRALAVSGYGTAERSGPGASTRLVESVRAHWQVSLPKLALIWPSVAGSLETTGTADGPVQSLTANVQVQSKIAVRGSAPGTVEATLLARGLPSAPSATMQASGSFGGAPLRLQASLARATANTFHILIPRATWKSLAIHADLTAGRDLAASRGSLRLQVAQLSDLQPFVGRRLEGAIAASIDFTPGAGGTHARFDLAATHVVAGGIAGDARLTAAGPLDALRIQVTAHSPGFHGAPASLAAGARLDETKKVLQLDRFEARYHDQTVRLLSPSRVLFAHGLRVRNLRLGAQKAVVALDGELSPSLDLRASVRHVNAALVDAFVPNLLSQGNFQADAQLRGSRSSPVGRASIELTGLKLGNSAAQGLPAVDIRGSARFRGSSADVVAQLGAGPGSRLTLSGRAPLSTAGPIALKLAGRMDAALMNSILEARGEHAAGTLTVNASVSGTAHEPQISGVVQLANGDLRDYAEGVHLDHIDARLVGGRGILKIEKMTARAGPGQLSAKGTVGVLQPGIPVHISLTAHHIQPITNDILTANLDANMQVAGTLRKRVDVTGTVHINHASITVPNGFPPSVATLEVIRPGQPPHPAGAAVSRLVVGLGITLDAPASIFVEGRGLSAQLGGQLKVAGTSDDPQVSGGFSMVRGVFALAGTNLNFTSGRVSFTGQGLKGGIDPSLDFIAQSSVTYNGPTTVTLRVTGFADSPKISLSSSPPLPQDDLLALLLFGKPASKLGAIELAETGAALASLSGIGPGGGGSGSKWNPLTWIKKGLGLNNLSIGGASPPGGAAAGGGTTASGASITAGKYVSRRVYLTATQTTYGTSQLQVDIALSNHLKLQTRLGNGAATAQGTTPQNDPGSSIGLAWQMSY
ncbi:MAG: translocation/assembly module TamB domain-containing protein [Steroidobacteraceae bacterium]